MILNEIPVEAILDTYRGRPGCGCGCRGTYSKTTRAIKSRIQFLADVEKYVKTSDVWTNYGDNGEDVVCFTYDDDEVSVWVYVNAAHLPTPVREEV